MPTSNECSRFLIAAMRDEVAKIGEKLFEHSETAHDAWRRIEESLIKRGCQLRYSACKQFNVMASNLSQKKRKYAAMGEPIVLNDVEEATVEMVEIRKRVFQKRDADLLECAILIEKRWNDLCSSQGNERKISVIYNEIVSSLSINNYFRRKECFISHFRALISSAEQRCKNLHLGHSKKYSEAQKILLRLYGITHPSISSHTQPSNDDPSENGVRNRAPLMSLENSSSIRGTLKENEPNVAGPSRMRKRRRSSNTKHNENDPPEHSDSQKDPWELTKRKRVDEEQERLLKENEARFGKRPEYGTHAYFEWVGQLYGMPLTGSVPELKDSSSDEQNDLDEEGQQETGNGEEEELNRGTSQVHQAPITIVQPAFSASNTLSIDPCKEPIEWLKATIVEFQNQPIGPPTMDGKGLNERELKLKMQMIELVIELVKIKNRQMEMENWYVMQAGQIDLLPTDVLLKEGNQLADELDALHSSMEHF